jgi:transcriptional regulator of acetoin/glycerol metabolism
MSAPSAGVERLQISRLDEMTRQTVRRTLTACGGNISEAARQLGVNRSTLYRRLLGEGA